MNAENRVVLRELLAATPECRFTAVLRVLGIASSSWYRQPIPEDHRRRPGPKAKAVDAEIALAVVNMAVTNPWYGYKRIAVMCRREGSHVKDREAYIVMRDHDLQRKLQVRQPELYQAAKLFELLPDKPNDLCPHSRLRLVVRSHCDGLLLALPAGLSFKQ